MTSEYINSIICGDSLQVLKTIDDDSIDLTLTSPPYNLGIDYDHYQDNKSLDEYYRFLAQILVELYRVTKPSGRVVINHYLSCGTTKERYTPLMTINEMACGTGFRHCGMAIWEDATVSQKTAWGAWCGVNYFVTNPYEGLIFLCKGEWNKKNKGETYIGKEEFVEAVHGKWFIQPETNGKKNTGHPATFPVSLASRVIRMNTYEGDLILDPFVGSGTTALSAVQNNRNFIGIDLSPEYCQTACNRIAYDNAQLDMLTDKPIVNVRLINAQK